MRDPQRPVAADAGVTNQAPAVDLGTNFGAIEFAPGRFAVLVERDMGGVHVSTDLRQRSNAQLVIELGGDGTATVCQGWRHALNIDGPGVHQSQFFRAWR